MNNKKMLFVCGCPRSGTTAMWRLLVSEPRIVMGVERYGAKIFSPAGITPAEFEEDRFFEIRKYDTFYDDLIKFNPYYKQAKNFYKDAIYTGDKIPLLYQFFGKINTQFPGAKIVMMVRNIFDVAASYKVRALNKDDLWWPRDKSVGSAIDDWNASIKSCSEGHGTLDILPVDYDALFSNDHSMRKIFKFLDLDISNVTLTAHSQDMKRARQLETARDRSLSQEDVTEICMRADFDGYRRILKRL